MNNETSPRAFAYRGKKYTMSSGQASGEYFWLDCVGWVSMAIHQSLGIGSADFFSYWAVPTQYSMINQGGFELLDFSENNLKPGDILCNYYHVMVYCGDGKIVHCDGAGPNGTGVHVQDLSSYYGYSNITKVVRITDEIASTIDYSNATTIFEGSGALDDRWDLGIGDSTTSTGTGWIVDPNDKLELFKHILFTEKYNFNYIKWERYGHDTGSFTVTTTNTPASSSSSSGTNSSSTQVSSNGLNSPSNPPDNTSAEVNDNEGYKGTFTDSKNRTYKEYKQEYGPYANNTYSNGVMATAGCGPTSVGIIASGYGINYTPEDARVSMVGHTDSEKLLKEVTNKLHLTGTHYDSNIKEKLLENLKAGRPAIISTNNTPTTTFTKGDHICACLGINDQNEVWVSNPNSARGNGWYDIDFVVQHLAYIITIDSDK